MPNINISVKNKIAEVTDKSPFIVCGNSDYVIVFDLDEEWNDYIVRTARFVYGGNYMDVALTGNEVIVPVIPKAAFVSVGLFAGDITTTTPAVIPCIKSITSDTGTEIEEPAPSLYQQLLDQIDAIREELIESGGPGGTADHTKLKNRDIEDQHPMSAITGLEDAIAEKISQTDLQNGIDTALTQARESGEFNGKDGTDGISATHSWDGTVLTITSASGTSSADLKGPQGDKGNTGPKGDKGDTGAAGKDGANGTDGINGKDGSTPVKGTDYWTAADKEEIIADTKEAIDLSGYAKKAELENYLPLTGGTTTGAIIASSFQTGTAAANYFQTKKMRGQGDANNYNHAVDWGYAGHDRVDFHEYGGTWNFYRNTSGTSTSGQLVGSIQPTGWNGGAVLTGTPTAPTATAGTSTTQIATTEFVTKAIENALTNLDASEVSY